jgi:predicted NBD/HSP70 family sugar kinase
MHSARTKKQHFPLIYATPPRQPARSMDKAGAEARLNREMANANVIGVDLGGTKIVVARFDVKTFERQAEERVPTRGERGFIHVLDDVAAVAEKMRDAKTKGLGIGIPGLIRQPQGVVVTAPNIPGSENVDALGILRKKTNLNVQVENDANCFALAEAVAGAGKGKKIVVGITMGTGVGGGIVVDEQLFRGAHGYAAEVGHMLLRPGNPPYRTDDARGSVEQFLSGTAMGLRCTQAESPQDYLEGEVCSFLQPQVFREVAWFVTDLTYLIDPSIIVFGGSAGAALGRHLDEVRKELPTWMLPNTTPPELAPAVLHDSGALGAALLCKD